MSARLRPSLALALASVAIIGCSDQLEPSGPAISAPGQASIAGQGSSGLSFAYGYLEAARILVGKADNFAVSVRANPLQDNSWGDQVLFGNMSYSYDAGFMVVLHGDGSTMRPAIVVAPDLYTYLDAPVAITVGQWHTIEAARKSGAWSITVDGVVYALGTAPAYVRPSETGGRSYVGGDPNISWWYDGLMDDLVIKDATSGNTINAFPFEEGSGLTTKSATGTSLALNTTVWIPTHTPTANGQPITSCGTVISAPGAYSLVNDLVDCWPFGISVMASNVTLSLNGHAVDGGGASGGGSIGIRAGIGVSGGISALAIVGPGVVREYDSGIAFEQVRNSRATDVIIEHGGHGFGVNAGFNVGQFGSGSFSTGNTLQRNHLMYNQFHGYTLNGGANNVMSDNELVGNGVGGAIYLFSGDGNRVLRNVLSYNDEGITVEANTSQGNLISGNKSLNNYNLDAFDKWGDCTHNTWRENVFGTKWPSCIP